MLPPTQLSPGLSELEQEVRLLSVISLLAQHRALVLAGEEYQKALSHRLCLVRLEMERRGLPPC